MRAVPMVAGSGQTRKTGRSSSASEMVGSDVGEGVSSICVGIGVSVGMDVIVSVTSVFGVSAGISATGVLQTVNKNSRLMKGNKLFISPLHVFNFIWEKSIVQMRAFLFRHTCQPGFQEHWKVLHRQRPK
jgi:hypothetical protein